MTDLDLGLKISFSANTFFILDHNEGSIKFGALRNSQELDLKVTKKINIISIEANAKFRN